MTCPLCQDTGIRKIDDFRDYYCDCEAGEEFQSLAEQDPNINTGRSQNLLLH